MKLKLQNDFNTSFPNTYILLRQYLTLPVTVTNCAGERSFSHLKRIKSALRSTHTDSSSGGSRIFQLGRPVLGQPRRG